MRSLSLIATCPPPLAHTHTMQLPPEEIPSFPRTVQRPEEIQNNDAVMLSGKFQLCVRKSGFFYVALLWQIVTSTLCCNQADSLHTTIVETTRES